MWRKRTLIIGIGLLAIFMGVSTFALSGVATADPPANATVLFGDPNAGSPFPPGGGHDSSDHAADKLIPRTATISQGGTVTFETFGVHQVAIYDASTSASDINTSQLTAGGSGCPPVPLIDDSDNRLAVLADQPCAGGSESPSFTFENPGRYLVICNFLPHFEEADMFGWVIVK
jgi:plastocyanin